MSLSRSAAAWGRYPREGSSKGSRPLICVVVRVCRHPPCAGELVCTGVWQWRTEIRTPSGQYSNTGDPSQWARQCLAFFRSMCFPGVQTRQQVKELHRMNRIDQSGEVSYVLYTTWLSACIAAAISGYFLVTSSIFGGITGMCLPDFTAC